MTRETSGDPTLTVKGVTVTGFPPVGVQHVPLASGLMALYGKNGVGKIRLLAAVDQLLRAKLDRCRPDDDLDSLPASREFHSAGGIHIHAPISRGQLDKPWNDEAHSQLTRAVREWLDSDPWSTIHEPWLGDDGSEVERPAEPSRVSLLGLTEPQLLLYLDVSRWYRWTEWGNASTAASRGSQLTKCVADASTLGSST